MNKQALRKLYLQKRTALSITEYTQLNLKLTENFFAQYQLSSVTVLHIFLTIEKKKEPNTWPIIERIKNNFPHIRVVVPKIDQLTGQLENYLYEGSHQLRPNEWDIPEPVNGVQVPPWKIDMLLVPMLAFDIQGNRVGYGRGFYDRLISRCRPDCVTVGLSLFPPVEQVDDINSFDRPLSSVVTPSGVHFFQEWLPGIDSL